MKNPNMAAHFYELLTPRQLVAIRGIANAEKIDGQDFCLEIFACLPEELNRKAASRAIDYLKDPVKIAEYRKIADEALFIGEALTTNQPAEAPGSEC